jgi:hypothetical protein
MLEKIKNVFTNYPKLAFFCIGSIAGFIIGAGLILSIGLAI